MSIGPGLFARAADVSATNDGKQWFAAGSGEISRTSDGEHLKIPIASDWSRYLRLTVLNGDNSPLKVWQIKLSGVRRTVTFPSKESGTYFVYVGNAGAEEPNYDLPRIMPTSAEAAQVSLGKREENPAYQAPVQPWTDRYPILLNGFLILAVAAMAYIAIRFLKQMKTVRTDM